MVMAVDDKANVLHSGVGKARGLSFKTIKIKENQSVVGLRELSSLSNTIAYEKSDMT